MKIHVWGINYSPEVTGIGPYNAVLCEWLARQGHTVRMVTSFCYYPAWQKLPSEARIPFRTDEMDGVTVHRCWHYVPKRVTNLGRMVHELSFVLTSFLRQLFLPRPDLLVVISPPLLVGAAAWLLSKIKRTEFLFHVQDLQPDAAASLGMLDEQSLVLRGLKALESFAYSKASRVSAITPGMLRKISEKGVPASKLLLFVNGVDLPDFWRLPERGLFRKTNGYGTDEFLVVYSGNLGRKQGLDQLIRAAKVLRNPRIRFVICGDGAERQKLAAAAAGMSNVSILPLLPEPRYRELLVDADLCVVPQQAGSGTCFFPSKLLSILSFSAPVLAITEKGSELDKAVTEGGFGVSVPPNCSNEIAMKIDQASERPECLKEWGRAGFKFVKRFEQSTVLAEFSRALDEIFESGRK